MSNKKRRMSSTFFGGDGCPPSPSFSIGSLGSLPVIDEQEIDFDSLAMPEFDRKESTVSLNSKTLVYQGQTEPGQESGPSELFTKHLTEAKQVPRLPHSVELNLFKVVEGNGEVPEVSVEELVTQIIKDPRNSVVASMGLGNIGTNCDGLTDRVATWNANAEYYKEKHDDLVVKERDELESAQRIQKNYMEIHRTLKTQNLKYKATRVKREKAGAAERVYKLRGELGQLILDILEKMKARTFTPWAERSSLDKDGDDKMKGDPSGDNVSIEDIRKTLKLKSSKAVCSLGMVDLLAVLCIMELMNYVDHSFFRGLWVVHPNGLSHADFCELYGDFPTEIKKGRSRKSSLLGVIQMRVCHYLGFDYDPSTLNTDNLDEYEKHLEGQLAYVKRQKKARNHALAPSTAAAAQAAAAEARAQRLRVVVGSTTR